VPLVEGSKRLSIPGEELDVQSVPCERFHYLSLGSTTLSVTAAARITAGRQSCTNLVCGQRPGSPNRSIPARILRFHVPVDPHHRDLSDG
jgi:hypothetical protein